MPVVIVGCILHPVKKIDTRPFFPDLVNYIPNRGEQVVRYYGYYSNKMRGIRRKAGADDALPALMEPDVIRKILVHLDLWETRNRDPPTEKHTQIQELTYGDSYSQLPFTNNPRATT
ncbi:MAG: hypothetical protein KKF00_03045 [Proteobacteria bacterium]|nr:hypothetical protein [Pseudomonadota bacterium]